MISQGDRCLDDNQAPGPPAPKPPPGGAADVTLKMAELGLEFTGPARIRDVWSKKDLAASVSSIKVHVPYHGSAFLVVMPASDDGKFTALFGRLHEQSSVRLRPGTRDVRLSSLLVK